MERSPVSAQTDRPFHYQPEENRASIRRSRVPGLQCRHLHTVNPMHKIGGELWQVVGAIGSAVIGLTVVTSGNAQIVPDGTLGTQVVGNCAGTGGVCAISGGSQHGGNLFHSFQQFSLPNNRDFAGFVVAPDVRNAIVRVTGQGTGFISNINGTISTSNSVNFFLLNPNGILFGSGATLNIGGSFLATTAERMLFQDGTAFSTRDQTQAPLLTISAPTGLQMGRRPGEIRMQGSLLFAGITSNFTSFALLGGNISLNRTFIGTLGQKVELGSVAGTALVGLNLASQGLNLSYEGVQDFGDIQLSNRSFIDVSGEGGGNVHVQAANLLIKGFSGIAADTLGATDGGKIFIQATNAVVLDEGAITAGVRPATATGKGGDIFIKTGQLRVSGDFLGTISVSTFGKGQGGNLLVEADRVILNGSGQLTADTRGSSRTGQAGSITVRASDSVQITGTANDRIYSGITSTTLGSGNGGNLAIYTPNLLVQGNAVILNQVGNSDFENVIATGTGGHTLLEVGHLSVQDGAQITAGTFSRGQGGRLTVNASESIEIAGINRQNGTPGGLIAATYGEADAGDITITTRRLSVRDGGTISTSTASLTGQGHGGNLTINAPSGSVEVIGFAKDSQGTEVPSTLEAETGRALGFPSGRFPGMGGNLTINSVQLSIRDGAQVSTSTYLLAGQAGNLTVNVPGTIEVVGTSPSGIPSRLSARTRGIGNAGNLTVRTGRLLIQAGAEVSTSTSGGDSSLRTSTRGQGGALDVTASNSVEVLGLNSGLVSVSFLSTGNAGNLRIYTGRLTIRDGGSVSTSSIGQGRGGDIDITALDSVQVSGSGTAFDSQFGVEFYTIPSEIATRAFSLKDAGNLFIYTPQLIIQNGAEISAETGGRGNGGYIGIRANTVSLANSANLTSRSTNQGDAGNIEITANSIRLTDKSSITTTTRSSQGGNINLGIQDILLLRHSSQISTTAGTAQAGGDGGNITINSPNGFIVGVLRENSDITANAFTGSGGNVTITAQGIYGLKFQPRLTPTSDITASSEFGSSGTVTLNIPDTDPSRGFISLPVDLTDPTTRLDTRCQPGSRGYASSYIETGRGGVPQNPEDPLIDETVTVGWAEVRTGRRTEEGRRRTEERNLEDRGQTRSPETEIIEAQAIGRDRQGHLWLVAETNQPKQFVPPECQNQRP